MAEKMTHSELVEKASRWLRSQGCAVVITEMAGGSQEPDAIGWHSTNSILVECKASRADFLGDKKKCHQRARRSVGDMRYYFAPKGIIKPNDLPEKWGLLEPRGKVIKKIVSSGLFYKEKNHRGEMSLLISALRRVKGIMPEGVSARFYTYETKNRATVGIGKKD